jgi:putative addiction module component (TIGR02574 family)
MAMAKMTLDEVREAVKELTAEERDILSQELLIEKQSMVPSIERAWITEAERRLEELESGKVKGIPAEEVLGRIQRRIDAKSAVSSSR